MTASPTPPPTADVALYGHDPLPGLIDVQPLLDGDPARMRLYRRAEDGASIQTEDVPFYPFFFLSEITYLRGFPRERYRFQHLAGENAYRYLVVFHTWGAYWEALRHVERATKPEAPTPLYLITSPAQQYLMQSGRTCFKGMAFDDLHRLQLDIEVYAEEGFPLASRPGDAIIAVALSDNRGWRHLLHLAPGIEVRHGEPCADEAMLLRRLVEIVRERDPDVIEGHNIYAFDLAYLMARCERHGVPFRLGRDGSLPRVFPASMRFAERSVDYPALEIAGRHVIDTYFQVMSYDVFKRDLPAYGLKAAARYFGFAARDRTYIEGTDLARVWREDPARLLAYALDDATETERLARHLSGSTFYLTQMLPMPYGQVARTGPAAKIEALFVREYLRRRHSLPRSRAGSQTAGGYTDIFFTGVAGPIVYADVESLYPSIMLRYDVRPRSDALGLFSTLLRRLTDLRLETKRQMKTAPDARSRSELDARQNSFKVLINSFYGHLGFSLALFNDFEEADRVARTGQELLRRIIGLIREAGGRVIEVDTDGVLFVPPPAVQGEADERAFIERLNEAMPEGIRIGFEGRFKKMFSYKKKNYALLTYDDRLRFKGSSLVSRSVERFGRRFVREAVRLLMNEDLQGLHDLYLAYRQRILTHAWEGVEDFARTETLKDTLEQYEADVAAGRRPRAATYELARQRAERTGQPVRKGDRIAYYITGTGAHVTGFENARLAEAWDPNAPDENTAYYLRRLDEFARKFEPFFAEHDFRLLFSPEDMFGFSAEGIRLVAHEHTPTQPAGEIPF